MSSLVNRLAQEAAEPFERLAAGVARRGAPLLAGLACIVVSAVFLTSAVHSFLQRTAGAEAAAGIIGGVYLCAAILALVIARTGRETPETRAEAPPPPARKLSGESPSQPESATDFSEQIDRVIAPALNALGEAGLARERAILEAASAAAKELKPVAGVVLAIVTGFLIGRRLGKRP